MASLIAMPNVSDMLVEMKTFEEFLKGEHVKEYMGTDDNMPSAYIEWETRLTSEHLIQLAVLWGREMLDEILIDVKKIAEALER